MEKRYQGRWDEAMMGYYSMSGPWFERTNKYTRGNAVWASTFRPSGCVAYYIDLYYCIKRVVGLFYVYMQIKKMFKKVPPAPGWASQGVKRIAG